MNLYEINSKILELLENEWNEECIDLETGEIDSEKAYALLDQYLCNQNEKIENIALYIKNLSANAEAIKQEEANLKARRTSIEKKVESLKNYLENMMIMAEQSKFETAKCKISFRKSQIVDIPNIELLPKEFIKQKVEISADKNEIKRVLKEGGSVEGASLVEKQNIQIK